MDIRIKIDWNKLFILDDYWLNLYWIWSIRKEYEDDVKPYLKRLYKSAWDSFEAIVNNWRVCRIKYKYFKEHKREPINIYDVFGIKTDMGTQPLTHLTNRK